MMRNLLAEMTRYNVTAKDIQAMFDYNERTILNRLKGKSEFSVSKAIKIMDTFFPGMNIKYLFGEDTRRNSA